MDGFAVSFKVGDWIIYDAIGKGIYEVVSMGETHFDVKCKRIFEGDRLLRQGRASRCIGHVTNVNRGGKPIDYSSVKVKVVKVA